MGKNFSSRKLFACSNSTCPNRSHYTPACPNVTRKKTNTSSAVSTQPALSINMNRAASVKQGEGSGKIGGNVGEAFDRFTMMVEETEESFPTVLPDGTQEWVNMAGELHRSGGLPAVIRADGIQEWYQNGERHRVSGPAIVFADGAEMWYQHGKLHRDGDQPAIVSPNGDREWWQNDKRHRTAGPAFTNPNGYQEWWVDDITTEYPDLCEQACAPAHTSEEKNNLVLLCLHDDPVVAAVAAHNPDCPEEGTIAYNLKRA